jgi:hypothetical protein
MLDAASQRIVHQIIRDWVQQGRMFTASDLATAARRRGARALDNDVRELLQAMFQPGLVGATYTWTAIDVSGPEKVQLFHRLGDDPWQYDPSVVNSGSQGFFQWIWSALFGPPAPPPIEYIPPAANPVRPPVPPQPVQPLPQQVENVQTRLFDPTALGTGVNTVVNPGAPVRTAPSRSQPTPPPPPKHPTDKKLGLDASQFLPISRNELKNEASKTRRCAVPAHQPERAQK